MNDADMRLDGNAAAGLLQELFVHEVTTVRGICGECGNVAMIGAQHLYMYPHAPGAVLRCRVCSNPLLILVHGEGRVRMSLQGLTWVEMDDT
jgi:Family of unknown function (DUF6510)